MRATFLVFGAGFAAGAAACATYPRWKAKVVPLLSAAAAGAAAAVRDAQAAASEGHAGRVDAGHGPWGASRRNGRVDPTSVHT